VIAAQQISALILAGGRGSRMGPIMINANRNLAAYVALGVAVWPDELAGYAGMDAVRVCSLGQITTALFEVGGSIDAIGEFFLLLY
jgi:molybdopterin-guanine dinucleotide biosynthesis protein A